MILSNILFYVYENNYVLNAITVLIFLARRFDIFFIWN